MVLIKTKSTKETKEIAKLFLQSVTKSSKGGPLILALEGELGSGKTTFTQGLARALGIREKVLSPTFVLLKSYRLPAGKKFKHLIHIDCYRLDSSKDLLRLGFRELFKDRDAIILVEWADRVTKIIPTDAIWIKFKHSYFQERILTFSDAMESKKVGIRRNHQRLVVKDDLY